MEAYAADGWRGAAREKVKPVAEIKRAKDQVGWGLPGWLQGWGRQHPVLPRVMRHGFVWQAGCQVHAGCRLRNTGHSKTAVECLHFLRRLQSASSPSASACATATKQVRNRLPN